MAADTEILVNVAADYPPVPLSHLIRQDCATTALDLYELGLRGADMSSAAAVVQLAGLLDQTRVALSEFARVPLGNPAALDSAIRRGLWDERVRSLHDQLVMLLRQRAGA